MKKMLSALLITSMLIPSAAFAVEKSPDTKAKRTEFKQSISTKKQQLKDIHQKNGDLRKQIKEKRQEIKPILQSLKKSKDEASKAKLAKVKEIMSTLSTSKEALKELKGAGKPYWTQLKDNSKKMNLEAALGNIESIANVRNSRTESLTKINTTLDEVLNIIK